MARIFISHSTEDRDFVDPFVEKLRQHYLETWYSPRDIEAGSWQKAIRDGLEACDWFVVVCSPKALLSTGTFGVVAEVNEAMNNPKYFALDQRGEPTVCRVIPVVARECGWKSLHPFIGKCQKFDFTKGTADEQRELWKRLLRTWQVDLHEFPLWQCGDVKLRAFVFVGGDGRTKFRTGDILCKGPLDTFDLPADVREAAYGEGGIIHRKRQEAEDKGRTLVNNRQVRLAGARWGGASVAGGLENRPLQLRLDWTQYEYNRRDRLRSMTWANFGAIVCRFPLAAVRTVRSLYRHAAKP